MHRIRSRSVRLLLVPALTVPFVLAAVLALPGAASAKSSGPKGKITCTAMNGSETSGTITISGCTGTALPGTGGGSKPLTVASLATGGPVTWVNNQVTTFLPPALNTSGKPKHCPGYVKPPKREPYDASRAVAHQVLWPGDMRQHWAQGSGQVQGRGVRQQQSGAFTRREAVEDQVILVLSGPLSGT